MNNLDISNKVNKDNLNKKSIISKKNTYSSNLLIFFSGPPLKPDKDNELVYSINLGKFIVKVVGDAEKGLPYGLIARFIQLWVDTEIVYHSDGKGNLTEVRGGYRLELKESMIDFVVDCLGLSRRNVRDIQEQWEKLAELKYRTIYFNDKIGDYDNKTEITIDFTTKTEFSWLNNELVKSYIVIHPDYYDYIAKSKRWFLLDMAIVKKFVRNVEGIDIYKYIKHTCSTMKFQKSIEKNVLELQDQLCNKERTDNFRQKLDKILKLINKDELVKAVILPGKGRYIPPVLKMYSTYHLIKRKQDQDDEFPDALLVDSDDPTKNWLINQIELKVEKLERIREINIEEYKKTELEIKLLKNKLEKLFQ